MLALSVASAIGCANLGDIPTQVCGNHIVEADEDCETTTEPGTHCGAPNESGACRYTCGETGIACPASYGCGIDGVCRRLANRSGDKPVFQPLSGPVPSLAFALSAGDFDGDGRADLIGRGRRSIELIGLVSDNALTQKSALAANAIGGIPAIGVFPASAADERPRSDLAAVRPGGFVSVWRGETDGSLSSTFYSAFSSPGPFRITTGEVLPESAASAAHHGDEVLSVTSATDPPTLSYVDPTAGLASRVLLASRTWKPEDLAPLRTGRLDESLPCDHVVIGVTSPGNNGSVAVFPLCRRVGKNKVEPNEPGGAQIAPSTITLPAGSSVGKRGLFVIDVDHDGHLDVVIDGTTSTMIAYGFGDGTFHSAPGAKPATPDFAAAPLAGMDCGKLNKQRAFPLAMGQLTKGDNVVDFVTDQGICYRTATEQTLLDLGRVTDAVIGDVNGNGIDDVVATTPTAVEVLSSTGSFGNRFTYPASNPKNLAIGDFDGDLLMDAAFQETGDGTADTLSVMFGRPFSGPESPIVVGTVAQTEQIVAGAINPFGGDVDDLTDLGVISMTDATHHRVAFIRGSTDRQLEAPFSVGKVSSLTQSRHSYAEAVAAGPFLPGGHDSLAVVAQSLENGHGQLWLVPVGNDAQVDETEMKVTEDFAIGTDPGPISKEGFGFQWPLSRLVPVNLDGSPEAELVIVAPSDSATVPAQMWVVKVASDGGPHFVAGAQYPLGSSQPRRPLNILAADFNRDGKADVAVIVERDTTTEALLFWGKGDGTFDLGPTVPRVSAATVANIRGEERLVVAQRGGLAPVTFEGGSPTIMDPLVSLINESRPDAIVAADVDGDGVTDIAVAENNHVTVYLGVPELR